MNNQLNEVVLSSRYPQILKFAETQGYLVGAGVNNSGIKFATQEKSLQVKLSTFQFFPDLFTPTPTNCPWSLRMHCNECCTVSMLASESHLLEYSKLIDSQY